ncbi:MAG: glycosyltransferase [Candidatus Omnitrophica bacterium]|nr:glycosyltransferase [Candidatus Omnitrophota bacterium]
MAVLYLTKNDFNETACRSCLDQDYTPMCLIICDDGDDAEIKKKIDTFAGENQEKVRVIRRKIKKGYKAGNINHALKSLDVKYSYVLIMDADGMLPKDFLRSLMPYFNRNPKIAFVQAMQKSLPDQKGDLGNDLKSMVDIHWRYYVSLKNRFGFVMWYGHGAVLKRQIIEELRGIPEVVTEDLAFSSEVRRLGYYGIVAENVFCGEEFPRTLTQYRKRNRKWVRGTCEYLLKFFPKLLQDPAVHWFEKADVFISAFALLQALPFLIFVLVASSIIPYFYARFQMQGPLFLVPPLFYGGWMDVILKTRYNVFWVWDFYLIMFIVIFFPLLPAVQLFWKDKKQMLRYIALAAFVHLSILLDSAKEMILFLSTGKTFFPVTNNYRDNQDALGWLLFEFLSGAFMLVCAVKTANLWLVSLGVSFMVTILLALKMHTAVIRKLMYIPFSVTVLIMFFIGMTIVKNFKL